MAQHYTKSEMDFTTGRPICPECKNHKQITDEEWNKLEFSEQRELDCKNTYDNGQCCCYSMAHASCNKYGEENFKCKCEED